MSTSTREALLQILEAGLHSGFALEWQTPDPAGGARIWPGPALWAWARRLASHWRRLSLPQRPRVAVQLPNSPIYIATLLATWMLDGIFCPLPAWRGAQTVSAVDSLRPDLLIWHGLGRVHTRRQERRGEAPLDPEDLALMLWTSASMHAPRVFGLTHAALLWQVQSHLPRLALERDSLVRNCLPWTHVFAGVLELLPTLARGASLRVAALGTFRQESFTHVFVVPRVAALLQDTQIGALAGGIVGGAPISAELARRLRGSALRVGYGQTEAGPGVCLGDPGDFRPAFLGRALVEVEQRAGTLHYRSPGQALGEWRAGHWHPIRRDAWVDSGDVVRCGDDGCWYWLGRRDARFVLADGRNVEPELEELRLLTSYPEIATLVLGGPGARHPLALARLHCDPGPQQEASLRRRWHEPYPLRIAGEAFWDPYLGPNGKVQRGELYAHWSGIVRGAAGAGRTV
ncbi:MAG: AMP-binding protein [Acidithiobacillus caldus]|nr:AMP-binding protein [Acidithiobacillus caldus]